MAVTSDLIISVVGRIEMNERLEVENWRLMKPTLSKGLTEKESREVEK